MACIDSGLEVRDRMWLKITIANAFIGLKLNFSIDRYLIIYLMCVLMCVIFIHLCLIMFLLFECVVCVG